MKMLFCPICKRSRVANRKQQTCSKACAAQLVKQREGADFYRKQGQRAGRAAAVLTRKRTEARWRAKWPQVPTAIARAIYDTGFNSGHKSGKRLGYEQALRDSDPRYAAECALLDRGGHVRQLGIKGAA